MKRLLLCSLALLLSSGFTFAQAEKSKGKGHAAHMSDDAGVKDAVKKMENEMREDVLKGSAAAAEKYLADDYHVISGVNGQMYDKKQIVERIKSGASKYSQINVSDENVEMYDRDLAISHGAADVKMNIDGKDASGKYHYSRAWLKRNGKWQAIWFQTTRMM